MSDAETFANRRVRWDGDWLYVPGPSIPSFWYRVRSTGTCDDGSPDYQCEHSTFGQPFAAVGNPYVRWLLGFHYQREREIQVLLESGTTGEPQPLTQRQREVLDFIVGFHRAHGYTPTYREIGEHFGWSSSATVYDHITALQRKGHLRRTDNGERGITILPAGEA